MYVQASLPPAVLLSADIDGQGNNLLHLCCVMGRVDVAELLYERKPLFLLQENSKKLTPAALAVKVSKHSS
jgi:hypothetical protein